ncbi:MAG: TRAP transporter small permease [Rhizobiaceae bacterium]|nr:TRAP transporter small permease [Rhizobiaceae bacterium]
MTDIAGKPPNIATRALSAIAAFCIWIAGVGLVAMTAVVGWQVFGRYVLNSTPTWSEPVTLQLMGWFILLGAAVGVRENFHLGLDLVHHVVPKAVGRLMDMATLVLLIGFGLAMSWYSGLLVVGTWAATLPSLGLPGGFDYLPQAFGGLLISAFAAERLVHVVSGHVPVAAVKTGVELV